MKHGLVQNLLLIATLVGCAAPQRAPVIDRTEGASAPRPASKGAAPRPSSGNVAAAPTAPGPGGSAAPQGSTAPQPKPSEVVVTRTQPAWDVNDPRPELHTVQRGETLFGIALAYGLTYRELAEWNALQEPYVIRVGQQLRLRAAQNTVTVIPAKPTSVDSTTLITDQTEAAGPIGEASEPRPLPVPGSPAATPQVPAGTPAPASPQAPGAQTLPRTNGAAAPAIKTEPKAAKLPYTEANWARYEAPVAPVIDQSMESVTTSKAPVAAAGAEPRPAVSESHAPVAAPAVRPDPNSSVAAIAPSAVVEGVDWTWPTAGRLSTGFSDDAKGIRVTGNHGQVVVASAAGQVSYVGNSLRGYGKMIVIKHNKMFLSVYAHNSKVFVKEGQSVTKGQKIAEMGATDAEDVVLHFEIRRYGKPVDPTKYLPNGAAS